MHRHAAGTFARQQQLLEDDLQALQAQALGPRHHCGTPSSIQLHMLGIRAEQPQHEVRPHSIHQRPQEFCLAAFTVRKRIQHTRPIASQHRIQDAIHKLAAGVHGQSLGVGERGLGPYQRQQLVSQTQGISHAATRATRNLFDNAVLRVNPFTLEHRRQSCRNRGLRERRQLEHLHARQHRLQHLLRIGGREEKLHMRRRLFQRLEERVEGALRQHVDFVDDPHLVARTHRRVGDLLLEVAHIVDRGVRSGIDLDHIHFTASLDPQATFALQARLNRGTALAVQRLGKDARRGRLARSARTTEQVRVANAPFVNGALEHLRHRLLTHHVRKGARTVFASEDEVGHRAD